MSDLGIGTVKSIHSFVEYGIAQAYVPVITHIRTNYVCVWQGGHGQIQTVNTEKIEVRARLNSKLRRK